MVFDEFILQIKRQESPWAKTLFRLAKSLRQWHMPYIPLVHDALYVERRARLNAWRHLRRLLYYEPLMRSRCACVGGNFTLVQALPLILGNLRIEIGSHVTIDGTNTFAANRVFDEPVLSIGDHTFVGWHVTISVGRSVSIGRYCLIGANVLIADNDMHPLEWQARREHRAVAPERIRPVVIEDDVWIGEGCTILKGVRIGIGAVIGAGSVVTHDVQPYTVVAGQSAAVVKQLERECRDERLTQ